MQIPSLSNAWSSARRRIPGLPLGAFAMAVARSERGNAARPRLSEFIRAHLQEILQAWDEFAATVQHGGAPLDALTLRDHAAEILNTIAMDLAQPQSAAEQ